MSRSGISVMCLLSSAPVFSNGPNLFATYFMLEIWNRHSASCLLFADLSIYIKLAALLIIATFKLSNLQVSTILRSLPRAAT